MRIAIIGRTEILYETALQLRRANHDILLIITAKEAPEYTKTTMDFQELAKEWGISFIHTPRIEEAIPTIVAIGGIDIGVSLNYTGVIPESVIGLFRHGVLNAHAGDLPRYRGNAPIAWAIINGESRIGLCVHRMVGGELDSGDIISRDYFPLTVSTKITEAFQWMSRRIPALFSDALQKLAENPEYVLEVQSKDSHDALRGYPRTAEDGRIDWSRSAVEILRLINACNKPFQGASCECEAQRIIIWEAELGPAENFLAIPGQVTLIGDGWVDIATGKGKLRVTLVESEGELISPDQVVRSIRTRFR